MYQVDENKSISINQTETFLDKMIEDMIIEIRKGNEND